MNLLRIGAWRNNDISLWLLELNIFLGLGSNSCQASAIWTAYMNISFQVGNRILSELGEIGVFGRSSTLKPVAGVVVPPDGRNQNACNPTTNFSHPPDPEMWLALIERGGCTFTQKIKVATSQGAGGVIIYNFPGTGNQVFPMAHQWVGEVVVVMIGNLKGTELLNLIQKGVHVRMTIQVGRKHFIWMNHYFLSFIIVSLITLSYFVIYHLRRLWMARVQIRRWRQLATNLKKSVGQLQLRTLKEGDEETSPSGDSCVVCFEAYKPNDTVRVLVCKHFFHQTCIDPWILSHGMCPMCKCDILKALGIEIEIERRSSSLRVLMSSESPGATAPNQGESCDEHTSGTSRNKHGMAGGDLSSENPDPAGTVAVVVHSTL
ncbi:E3 ubiquitin-protein ligase RNF133-like [Tachyglossus aculeatus]|uniref:E3 ubiquitin-protein ligase RNF133-like n=1 Tax=Tachyglossus aculeatus TaxID=9261 RepID=UPI0018F5FBB1|nr:E3 ubiquitin-protein ligase RNF133-like [Tachyglossus aculeatus]